MGDVQSVDATDKGGLVVSVNIAEIERSTLRKVHNRIIPFIVVLYIISFLDRVNTGYAALQMNTALSISASAFGLVSGIFFIGYFLFEVPSNIMMHKIGAKIWIMRILVSWGIVASLTAIAQNVTELYVLRFLLGAAEAGFFPGIILYLTFWFRARDQAKAVAFFMTALALSGIIGGPVSTFILAHVHWGGLQPWRWLYILEGIPAVIFGVITLWVLPNRPNDAKWLTQEEKNWLLGELTREREAKLQRHSMSMWKVMADGRVWMLTLIYFCLVTGLYGIGFWLPQIVKALSSSYSLSTIGWLTAIPYVVAGIGMVLIGKSSDRSGERRWHTALTQVVGAIALVLLGMTTNAWVSIVLLAIATAGIYGFFGPFWAMPSLFLTEATAAVGIAFINSVGNLGGFFGPYIIGAVKQSTGSMTSAMYVLAAFLIVGAVLTLLMRQDRAKGMATDRSSVQQ
ncbi:putative tartrate transporter [Acidibacillus sp. S0AB]|uniref:Putative tartrate transporter n=1 Tax=Sulfoacidibacillus ferrooxidans TaxID=2005001 RepID=A0A9X2ADK2_9BACL|nr:putative tartrate transporter [Sulfoacidibacillus ferrooxidans]